MTNAQAPEVMLVKHVIVVYQRYGAVNEILAENMALDVKSVKSCLKMVKSWAEVVSGEVSVDARVFEADVG